MLTKCSTTKLHASSTGHLLNRLGITSYGSPLWSTLLHVQTFERVSLMHAKNMKIKFQCLWTKPNCTKSYVFACIWLVDSFGAAESKPSRLWNTSLGPQNPQIIYFFSFRERVVWPATYRTLHRNWRWVQKQAKEIRFNLWKTFLFQLLIFRSQTSICLTKFANIQTYYLHFKMWTVILLGKRDPGEIIELENVDDCIDFCKLSSCFIEAKFQGSRDLAHLPMRLPESNFPAVISEVQSLSKKCYSPSPEMTFETVN